MSSDEVRSGPVTFVKRYKSRGRRNVLTALFPIAECQDVSSLLPDGSTPWRVTSSDTRNSSGGRNSSVICCCGFPTSSPPNPRYDTPWQTGVKPQRNVLLQRDTASTPY
jgi:hypothetical protein